jgi:predicted ABC-type ATPase
MAPSLLRGVLKVAEFVNADVVATGLSAFHPERAAIMAGRVMLGRIRDLARQRSSFAFETTLASRSFAPWLAKLRQSGYMIHVVFLWLPTADAALDRVAERVRMGGHAVPEETRRRFAAGLRNFFTLYRTLSATWRVYDNSRAGKPRLIARGAGNRTTRVVSAATWRKVEGGFEA